MLVRVVVTLLILALAGGAAYILTLEQAPYCRVCHRAMHTATTCVISLGGGEDVEVCCPRCAFHFREGRSDVESVLVADFDTGDKIEAVEAFYVEGSSVHLCCSHQDIQKDASGAQYERTWDRCLPSLIAFRTLNAAEKFSQLYGGTVRTVDELLSENQDSEKK
jgi:hypothetical protein